MEHQVDLIGEALGADHGTCAGVVRLTSVPILVYRLLTPRIGKLLAAHPKLEVELIPDNRDFSLTRREADLAIRLARPTDGGMRVKAWRIGSLAYAVYASRAYAADDVRTLPWIAYEEAMAHLPQARWIEKAARRQGDRMIGLRVHDAETALEAAIAGLGRTLLPSAIADRIHVLRRLGPAEARGPMSRDVWMLAHADQLELRRITAVVAWIESVMRRTATFS